MNTTPKRHARYIVPPDGTTQWSLSNDVIASPKAKNHFRKLKSEVKQMWVDRASPGKGSWNDDIGLAIRMAHKRFLKSGIVTPIN